MCHVPPCGRAAPSPAATPPLHRIARSAALLLWRRCSALSLLLRTRNHAPSCPPSLQLLFRTINRDLGHPNANDDYIAPMFPPPCAPKIVVPSPAGLVPVSGRSSGVPGLFSRAYSGKKEWGGLTRATGDS